MTGSVEYFLTASGNDIVNLASNEYFLGNIEIQASHHNDIIWSNIGDDIIFGQPGNDTIDGGPGDDYITGDEGNDILFGGTGNDTYGYKSGDGTDIITELDGQDILSISGLTLEDLFFTRSGNNLLIDTDSIGNKITIIDQFAGSTFGIEEIYFSDEDYYFDLTSVSSVPIPGAALLFGSSLLGIIGIRRKLKK